MHAPADLFILPETDRLRTATVVCKTKCMLATLSRIEYLKITGALEAQALAILTKEPTERRSHELTLLQG